jgi:hypothetical protein
LLNVISCVYDDWADCPQGINVNFFTKNVCDLTVSYPAYTQVRFFVFDQDDELVFSRYADQEEITVHKANYLQASNGMFTVIAWGGIDSEVLPSELPSTGKVNKSDVFFAIPASATRDILPLTGTRVYYGESKPIYLPDPAVYGSIFKQIDIDMQELTNRITVKVEGLLRENNYEVLIDWGNG